MGGELRAHRVVWAALGVADAPAPPAPLAPLRDAFVVAASAFPRAAAASCLAFGAADAQAAALPLPPPGHAARFVPLPVADDADVAPLVAAVVHDLAATVLLALAARCAALTHSPAAVWQPHALGDAAGTALAAAAGPGRALKAAADVCLLAGSPADAAVRYADAAEALTEAGDVLWAAGAEAGAAAAALLAPASLGECTPRSDEAAASPALATRVADGLAAAANAYATFGTTAAPGRAAAAALAHEAQLQLARLFAARDERAAAAAALATALEGADGADVPLAGAERAALLAGCAGVAGRLGHRRRRLLLLWRAARLAGATGGADGPALALRLLSSMLPPEDAGPPDATLTALAALASVPAPSPITGRGSKTGNALSAADAHPLRGWRALRRALLWGCLTAATRGADAPAAWAVAARLLRGHADALSTAQQAGLLRALEAAAALLPPGEPVGEPAPPGVALIAVRPPLASRTADGNASGGDGEDDSTTGAFRGARRSVFVFSPFERSRAAAAAAVAAAARARAAPWVSGEVGFADVALSNPCSVPLRLEAVSLEADVAADGSGPSCALEAHPSAALTLPPGARGVVLQLRATPRAPGQLRLRGVRCFAFGAEWLVPWSPPAAASAAPPPAEVRVLPPMPLLLARLVATPPPGADSGGAASPPGTPSTPVAAPASPARQRRPSQGNAPTSPGGPGMRRTPGGARSSRRARGAFSPQRSAPAAPPDGAAEAAEREVPLHLMLLEGQTADVTLRLNNVGGARAAAATLRVDAATPPRPAPAIRTGPPSIAVGAPPVVVATQPGALAAALPLAPGGRAAVALRVTAGAAAPEAADFALRCVYSGDAPSAPGGREAAAALRVSTLPGLRALRATLRPLPRRCGAGTAGGDAGAPAADVALLQLQLANASVAELQVCARGDAAACDAAALDDNDAGAAWEPLAPGAALSLLLPARALPAATLRDPDAAAEALAQQLSVRWRGPGGASGTLHALPAALAAALRADDAVAALAPQRLRLWARIAAGSDPDGDAGDTPEGDAMLRAGELATARFTLRHAFSSEAALSVHVAVHASDGSRAPSAAVMWAGCLDSAPVRISPDQAARHALALLFLVPGRYTLVAEGRACAAGEELPALPDQAQRPLRAEERAIALATLHVHVAAFEAAPAA